MNDESKFIIFPKEKWERMSIFLLVIFIIAWVMYGYYRSSHLMKNYKIVVGQIDHITPPGYKNNSRGIDYHYFVNGKEYLGEGAVNACDNYSIIDLSNAIVNRNFYVAYDTLDLSSSNIILTKKQAERFNTKVTDTLLHFDSLINCELKP